MKKRNPICEAHSTRGGAGSGPHKQKDKKTASDERKQKHKKKIVDDSEDEL